VKRSLRTPTNRLEDNTGKRVRIAVLYRETRSGLTGSGQGSAAALSERRHAPSGTTEAGEFFAG
jgi:hypothetical protein